MTQKGRRKIGESCKGPEQPCAAGSCRQEGSSRAEGSSQPAAVEPAQCYLRRTYEHICPVSRTAQKPGLGKSSSLVLPASISVITLLFLLLHCCVAFFDLQAACVPEVVRLPRPDQHAWESGAVGAARSSSRASRDQKRPRMNHQEHVACRAF